MSVLFSNCSQNMTCANLFPSPPEGLIDWPWQPLANHSDYNLKAPPKISIVMPNYNCGGYLEKAIRSVLLQRYPNLEFIIIDGYSTDNSVDIIRKYEPWIAYWVSEKDRGQGHALNKGFSRCSGEIVNWLCSDDILLPGALFRVAEHFINHPDIDVLAGQGRMVFMSGEQPDMVGDVAQEAIELIPVKNPVCQPACFYRRAFLDRAPPIDESYHYAMDFELWAYFRSRKARWLVVDDLLCEALMTGDNKCSTGAGAITVEMIRVYRTYVKEAIPLTFWYRYWRLPLARFRARHPSRLAHLAIRPFEILAVLVLGPFYGFDRVRNMSFLMEYPVAKD